MVCEAQGRTAVLTCVQTKQFYIQNVIIVCEIQGGESNWYFIDMCIDQDYIIQDVIMFEKYEKVIQTGILTRVQTKDYYIHDVIMV